MEKPNWMDYDEIKCRHSFSSQNEVNFGDPRTKTIIRLEIQFIQYFDLWPAVTVPSASAVLCACFCAT